MLDSFMNKNMKEKVKTLLIFFLGIYIFSFLLTNFSEIFQIGSMLNKEVIFQVLLLSVLIHLLILPARMWLLIRKMVVENYSSLDYLKTHTNSFLMSISPLGLIGTETTRFIYINWKNEIKAKDKFYTILLDRLSGLIAVLSFGGIFLFTNPNLITILIAPISIVIIKLFFRDTLDIYKYSKAISISLAGFIIYAFQLQLVLSVFVPDIEIHSTVAIATLLVVSASLPFSIFGLSLREITFQQILIQIGFSGTMAMKIAILLVLSDLLINLLFYLTQKTLSKEK